MSKAFIVLQAVEDARPVVEAIMADNPGAEVSELPGLIKIDREHSLSIHRQSIEERIGRKFDLQEMQVFLISISGHLDEDDDSFTLSWNS